MSNNHKYYQICLKVIEKGSIELLVVLKFRKGRRKADWSGRIRVLAVGIFRKISQVSRHCCTASGKEDRRWNLTEKDLTLPTRVTDASPEMQVLPSCDDDSDGMVFWGFVAGVFSTLWCFQFCRRPTGERESDTKKP